MPFSARVGFFAAGDATPPYTPYDWPGYLTSDEFTTEVTNDFTGAGVATRSSVSASSMGYRGGILADNGKVYMCPRGQTNMLELDPSDDSVTKISLSGVSANEYTGGVLADNGKIYCPAFGGSGTILEFDPSDGSSTERTPTGSYNTQNIGGATLPSGKVMFQPRNSGGAFTIYDPATNTASSAGKTIDENFEHMGCVAHHNGNVYVMPFNGQEVSYYNEDSDTWTNIDVSSVIGNNIGACQGGAMMADGRICGITYGVNGIFVFDPSDDSFYVDTYGVSWSSSSQAYIGGALGADGNVYFANFNLTSTETHVFDTQANTVTRSTGVSNNRGNNVGAVATPSGNVYCVPNGSSNIAKIATTGSATYTDTFKSPQLNKGF